MQQQTHCTTWLAAACVFGTLLQFESNAAAHQYS
jgi:hypothetical protein